MNPARSILDDPEQWRKRAQEARTVAEQLSDLVWREMMLRVAERYERLAEHAERRAENIAPEMHSLPGLPGWVW